MSFHARLSASQRAALDVSRNIVLRAGAGSGKTTVLAHRYLWILEHGIPAAPGQPPTRVKVDEILTLTFTRKASEEMRQRIGDAISRQLDDPAQDDAQASIWLEARARLDVAPIATIHSFCHQLLEEFSLSAGIDPAFELVDDLDEKLMIEEAISAALEADESSVSELAAWWSRQQVTDILHAIIMQQPAIEQWIRMVGELSQQAIVRHMIDSSAEAIAQVRRLLAPQSSIARLSACLNEELAAFGEFSTSCPALKAMPHMIQAVRLAPEGSDPVALGYYARKAASSCLKKGKGDETPYLPGAKSAFTRFVNGMKPLEDKRLGVRERIDTAYMAAGDDLMELLRWARQIPGAGDVCLARHLLVLLQIGQRAHAHFRESLARHHSMTMDDLLLKTHEMLLAKPEIRAVLQGRYRQIMVDEFQDTDGLQWEIIRLLAGGDPKGTKPLEPSRLFIVGDDKQSIYRFRGADVSVFRAAMDAVRAANQHAAEVAALDLPDIAPMVPPGEVAPPHDSEGILELSTNYRSRVEVLEFINDLFGNLLTGGTADSPPYEAAPQRLDPRPDSIPGEPRVHLALYTEVDAAPDADDALEDEEAPEQDASDESATRPAKDREAIRRQHHEAVVGAMARALGMQDGTPGLHVADQSTGMTRPAQPGDIMLLLRSRTPLDDLRRHLSRRGIPYVVESKSTIFDSQEVRDIRNLLEFLTDPRNDVALFGVMRSPLFACDDTTLSLVALRPGGSLWERIEGLVRELRADASATKNDGHHGLAALDVACRLLDQWRRLAHRLPIHELLCAAFDQTCAWAAYTAAQRVNLDRVLTLVAEMDRRGTGEIASVVRRLDEAERQARKDENLGDTEAPGQAVRIMTVHASKGLESPIVVIGDLTYGGRNLNDSLLMLSEYDPIQRAPAVAVGLNPCQDLKAAFEPTGQDFVVASNLRNELNAREVAEIKRVFYVASTRAQDHLILVAPTNPHTKSERPWHNLLFREIQAAVGVPEKKEEAASWWADVWKKGGFGNGEAAPGIARYLNVWAMPTAQPTERGADMDQTPHDDLAVATLEVATRRAAQAPKDTVLAPMAASIVINQPAIVRLNPSEAGLLERCPGCYMRRTMLGIRPANTRDIHRPVRAISPAEFGSLVHRAMQENVSDLAGIRHLIRREAAGFGHYIEHPDFAATVEDTARRLARDVDHLHRQLRLHLEALRPGPPFRKLSLLREVPFAMRHGRMEVHGAIDLLVAFPDGTRCIVDFKTDHLKVGERPVDHMRQKGYDLQLSIYAHAVRRQLRDQGRATNDVYCMLCFTQSPEPALFEFDDAGVSRLESRLNRWESILCSGMAGLRPAPDCAECRAWLGHKAEVAEAGAAAQTQ